MVQMIARRSLVYAGKRIEAGGEFTATDRDAFLLRAVAKSADLAPDTATEDAHTMTLDDEGEPLKRKRGRPRKVPLATPTRGEAPMQSPDTRQPLKPANPPDQAPPAPNDPPSQPEQPEGASPVGRATGTYSRRDMTAEK